LRENAIRHRGVGHSKQIGYKQFMERGTDASDLGRKTLRAMVIFTAIVVEMLRYR
jgi:hypothetical protein